MLGQEECSFEVCIEHRIPFGFGDIGDLLDEDNCPRCGRRCRAGRGSDCSLNQRGDARFTADIAHSFDYAERLERGVVGRVRTEVPRPHADALFGKQKRRRAADAARSAGDDGCGNGR